MYDLVNEDGSVDENLTTSVIYAAYSWLTDSMNSPAKMLDDAILSMHRMRENGENHVSKGGRKVVALMSEFEDIVINGLGVLR